MSLSSGFDAHPVVALGIERSGRFPGAGSGGRVTNEWGQTNEGVVRRG
jgi:hypothetical protein